MLLQTIVRNQNKYSGSDVTPLKRLDLCEVAYRHISVFVLFRVNCSFFKNKLWKR